MARLLVHVEGQTEESFVESILRPHLMSRGFHDISPRRVGNNRLRQNRGGIRGWPEVLRDITAHLRQDPTIYATTMVDYYGLPQDDAKGWPGRAGASRHAVPADRARQVENAMAAAIAQEMGHRFDPHRFVPFVMMHEFEALLFSDCAAFSAAIGRADLQRELQAIRDEFTTPEAINDSPETAPSKRIVGLVREYQKPLFGVYGANAIGLDRIRQECSHFDSWLIQLESLAQ